MVSVQTGRAVIGTHNTAFVADQNLDDSPVCRVPNLDLTIVARCKHQAALALFETDLRDKFVVGEKFCTHLLLRISQILTL